MCGCRTTTSSHRWRMDSWPVDDAVDTSCTLPCDISSAGSSDNFHDGKHSSLVQVYRRTAELRGVNLHAHHMRRDDAVSAGSVGCASSAIRTTCKATFATAVTFWFPATGQLALTKTLVPQPCPVAHESLAAAARSRAPAKPGPSPFPVTPSNSLPLATPNDEQGQVAADTGRVPWSMPTALLSAPIGLRSLVQ